VIEWAGLEIR